MASVFGSIYRVTPINRSAAVGAAEVGKKTRRRWAAVGKPFAKFKPHTNSRIIAEQESKASRDLARERIKAKGQKLNSDPVALNKQWADALKQEVLRHQTPEEVAHRKSLARKFARRKKRAKKQGGWSESFVIARY